MKVTRLRKLRLEKGLSLETVASDNQVSPQVMSFYENLHRTPRLEIYRRLEQYYNCTEDLLEIVEIPDDTILGMNTKTF